MYISDIFPRVQAQMTNSWQMTNGWQEAQEEMLSKLTLNTSENVTFVNGPLTYTFIVHRRPFPGPESTFLLFLADGAPYSTLSYFCV